MKKVWCLLFVFLFVGLVQAEEKQNQADIPPTKCEKVCKRWEERKDCRPNPVFLDKEICAVYTVCVEWEEICR